MGALPTAGLCGATMGALPTAGLCGTAIGNFPIAGLCGTVATSLFGCFSFITFPIFIEHHFSH